MSARNFKSSLDSLNEIIDCAQDVRRHLSEWQGMTDFGMSDDEVATRIECLNLARLMSDLSQAVLVDREDALVRGYFGRGTDSYEADLALMKAIKNPKVKSRIALDIADGLVQTAEDFQHDYPETVA